MLRLSKQNRSRPAAVPAPSSTWMPHLPPSRFYRNGYALPWPTLSEDSGHDFSQLPVHSATRYSQAYRPLAAPPPRACPFGGAYHTCPSRLQTTLAIGQPGDEYEQEADRLAEKVSRMAEPLERDPTPNSKDLSGQTAQRRCEPCEEEDGVLPKKEPAGRGRWSAHSRPVPAIVQEVLRSPGQTLGKESRAFFEQHFEYDFSKVRVCHDAEAAESAAAVGAQAYTVGQKIVFGEGKYAPNTTAGRQLLAHELTHAIQQGETSIVPATIASEHGRLEAEAGRAALSVQENHSLEVSPCATQGLQRLRDPRLEDILERIRAIPVVCTEDYVATQVLQWLQQTEWLDPDNYQPVFGELATNHPAAFRLVTATIRDGLKRRQQAQAARAAQEQLDRDLELMQRTPGLLHFVLPAHTRHTYRDPSSQIRDPMLRHQSRIGTGAFFATAHFTQGVAGVTAGALDLLMLTALIAPVAVEAGSALAASGVGSSVLNFAGGELALASGALRAAAGAGWSFYLANAIAVNEIGVFTAGVLLSVEGDVSGLLRAMAEDPVLAAQILAEVWVIHANIQASNGRSYRATIEAQPLPVEQQRDPSALRLRVVRPPVLEPVPESTTGAPTPPVGPAASRAAAPRETRAPRTVAPPSAPGVGAERDRPPSTARPGETTPAQPPRVGSTLRMARSEGLTAAETSAIARVRQYFKLPEKPTTANNTIVGILITETGEQIPIHSGRSGGPWGGTHRGGIPRGPGSGADRYIVHHVEGHAAAIMRARGIPRAWLLIEKPPCPACGGYGRGGSDIRAPNTAKMLPEGSQLLVIDSDSATYFRSTE